METVDLASERPTEEAVGTIDGSAAHAYGVLPLRLEETSSWWPSRIP